MTTNTEFVSPPTRTVQYYDNVLEALQRALPGSVHIAGGAVRDTILGRPIRDVDIFLHEATGDAAAGLLRSNFGYVKVGQWVTYDGGFSDPVVARVAKFEKADESIPICLIGLAKDLRPRDNIARFDFGICMAAWEGGQLIKDDRFLRDAESSTFTLCRADDLAQYTYSMARFEKLTADRYKGWSLAVPDEFQELTKEHTFKRHWYREDIPAHFGSDLSNQILRPKSR